MAAPIDLRNDFDSVSLRRLAKRTRDATQSRRLLALAEALRWWQQDGCVAEGGVELQIIRDWVLRFNARGTGILLVDGKPGRTLEARGRSPPRTARLLRPVIGPGGDGSCAGGARTCGFGDVRHVDRRDHGRARVEGARLAKIRRDPRPLRAKRAGRRGFYENHLEPNRRRSGRLAPERRRAIGAAVAS